jgi:hypothetical protein
MAGTTIDPNSVYTEGAISIALDIPLATLTRARREGRLQFTRKGKRVLLFGQWVLNWLKIDSPKGADHGR